MSRYLLIAIALATFALGIAPRSVVPELISNSVLAIGAFTAICGFPIALLILAGRQPTTPPASWSPAPRFDPQAWNTALNRAKRATARRPNRRPEQTKD